MLQVDNKRFAFKIQIYYKNSTAVVILKLELNKEKISKNSSERCENKYIEDVKMSASLEFNEWMLLNRIRKGHYADGVVESRERTEASEPKEIKKDNGEYEYWFWAKCGKFKYVEIEIENFCGFSLCSGWLCQSRMNVAKRSPIFRRVRIYSICGDTQSVCMMQTLS